jgi:valyl-tRNA synthetase
VGGDAGRGAEFDLVRELVTALRTIRSEYRVPPGQTVEATVVPSGAGARRVFDEERGVVARLTRCATAVSAAAPAGAAAHAVLSDGSEVVVPLAGLVDVEKECARLRGELATLDRQLGGLAQRLANPGFVSRAKPEVVDAERVKQRDYAARREQLARKVANLCGG